MSENKYAIVTVGNNHFVLPINNSSHNRGDDIMTVTLKDGVRLEVGTNNIMIITGESEIIESILKMVDTNFYSPEIDNKGKVKMKKITQDRPFKLIKGGKNE